MSNPSRQLVPDGVHAVLNPGNFALGSPESRVAARALLEARFAERKRIDLVFPLEWHHPGCIESIVGKWEEAEDGTLRRRSWLPSGMTMAEVERIVSQPGWKPSPLPMKPELRPPVPE